MYSSYFYYRTSWLGASWCSAGRRMVRVYIHCLCSDNIILIPYSRKKLNENYGIKENYNLTAVQHYSTTASGSVGFWLDGLCHLMTCGQQDWEPTSKQITVKASQTNACKWENLLCFISHYIHERPSKYKSNWKQLDFYDQAWGIIAIPSRQSVIS